MIFKFKVLNMELVNINYEENGATEEKYAVSFDKLLLSKNELKEMLQLCNEENTLEIMKMKK